MKDRVQSMIRQGKRIGDIAAGAPTKEFDEMWAASGQSASMSVTGLFCHTHKLGAILLIVVLQL